MAHMPGLSEEQEQEVTLLTEEINNIDMAINNISKALNYFDNDTIKVPAGDLEVIMKAALKYQKGLLTKKSEYISIIEENTPKPSFK